MRLSQISTATITACFMGIASAAPAPASAPAPTHLVTVGAFELGATSYKVKSADVCSTAIKEAVIHFGIGQSPTVATCTDLNTGKIIQRCQTAGGYKTIPRTASCTALLKAQ